MKCILNTFHIHFAKINRVFLHCTVLFRQFSVCSLFFQIIIIKLCWYHIVWWFELKIKRNKTFSVWKSKSLVDIFNSWQIFCTSESKQTKNERKMIKLKYKRVVDDVIRNCFIVALDFEWMRISSLAYNNYWLIITSTPTMNWISKMW